MVEGLVQRLRRMQVTGVRSDVFALGYFPVQQANGTVNEAADEIEELVDLLSRVVEDRTDLPADLQKRVGEKLNAYYGEPTPEEQEDIREGM
mgnify:FL=1